MHSIAGPRGVVLSSVRGERGGAVTGPCVQQHVGAQVPSERVVPKAGEACSDTRETGVLQVRGAGGSGSRSGARQCELALTV